MRIQHNIMAMGAYRNYTSNVNAMKKNLEKLSSGYKINRAGDDAAGLAISEKMRAQITGLETAQKNAKDGISLVQTAEGALTEVHDMLNRMVTLATQSANGTYDNETDRVQLQKELNQLRSEIDRIADSSNFNGIKLLDGTRAAQSTSALGSAAAQLLSGLDGTAPTKAGAAEITVNMKDGSAAAAETLKGTSTDGTGVIAGTKAEFTIKLGGQGAISDAKIENRTFKLSIGGKEYNVTGSTVEDQANSWIEQYNDDATHAGYTATVNGTGAAAQIVITKDDNTTADADETTFGNAAGLTTTNGTNGTFTAGADGGANSKFEFNAASVSATAGPAAATSVTNLAEFDLSGFKAGDTFSFKAGGKTLSYTVAANSADALGDLGDALEADGFKLDVTAGNNKAKLEVEASEVGGGFDGTGSIKAGDTVQDLLDLELDTSDVKVGTYFDVEVTKADGTKTSSSSYVLQNGDTIKLTAKYGGDLTDTKIADDLAAMEDANDAVLTGDNAIKATTKLDQVGADEGNAATNREVSRYTMTFDMTKLNAGQTIEIDGKTFKFVTQESTTPATNTKEIVLSTADGNNDGSNYDEVADAIKAAITANDGLGTTNWSAKGTYDATTNKYTLVLETADNVDAADKTNQGEARVKVGATADGKFPINVTYERAGYVPATGGAATTTSPFATATYEHAALKTALAEGDKIYIGDAEIEVVANGTTNLTAKQITVADAVNADKLAKVIEQQKPEFGQGKVKFDLTNGKITITGTEIGQTGAALKKEIGDVKFLDKSATTTAASTATSSNEKLNIVAGDTKVGDLLGADLQGITGNKLGDIFDITVNGNAKDDEYVIQEGDVVKFTAKPNAQLDEKVMDNFKYTGDITSLTIANGYDEGSNASGNKTRYNLTIDMAKIAGGNSFTFGNVNGKSVTFDISYDAKGTGNNTVGANDKDDIADSDGSRVVINLYGKTTAQAQEEIYSQVSKAMGGDFTVSRATSGNKITLNLEANKEGIDYNFGNIRYSSASGAFSDAVYNPAGGAAGGVEGTHAKAVYKFDASQLQVGDVLSIGDAKINFVDGETGTTSVNGKLQFNVNLADAKADPNGAMTQMLESAGFKAGQIRFDLDNKTLSIEGKTTGQTSADLQAEIGSIGLTSSTNRAMETGGLKLQIGDTADTFNQLTVDIQDMHAEALGLDAISIADQNNAAKAIDVIKAAINTVSDVRGTLGATQNRLDHTINNLSVMTENIQDAESTIRDTDVAAEMMEYTKNNILIQSAQAMLAQANQVPQGVLQLLQ